MAERHSVGTSMIGQARTPNYAGLKPTWKGNLLLFLLAMFVSIATLLCLQYEATVDTHNGARDVAVRIVKLPAGSQR